MKLLFDFDDEHSYISRLNEQIKEIVVNSTDDKSTIIPSDDSINQILKESEVYKNDEIDINPELVYELLEITVNAIRKFNKLFNQYYHD